MSKKRFAPRGKPAGEGDGHDVDLARLRTITDDQRRVEGDMTASDSDQTASDVDQGSADLDRDFSQRDQLASDRDQAAADRDQVAADRELERHREAASVEAYEAGRAGRAAARHERDEATEARTSTAEERAMNAEKRDEIARQRDLTAHARDVAAEQLDRESVELEQKVARRGSSLRVALGLARDARVRGAGVGARAADDRAHAARERERAAMERAELLAELRRGHLDDLTGALRRGAGELALKGEVARAHRGDGKLVLAFVDIDSLREVNNRDGHAAGDALLRDVVSTIRSSIRSYEPIVRYGGDEFLCAVTGVDQAQAEERFAKINRSLATGEQQHEISVGLAQLQPDDQLSDLIERADKALLDSRRGQRGGD